MGADTSIEWCDHTFNPWIGCTKVSPGCVHCYAARQDKFRGWTPEGWGKGKPRKRTSAANWKQPIRWNDLPMQLDDKDGHRRPRVFCASLADWLDAEVPSLWLADLLHLIEQTPNLDWLLLTKRPENWRLRLEAVCQIDGNSIAWPWLRGTAPHNVWIGTTVEDQERADERIPHLLRIPARVRFLSCEPLIGPIHFSDVTRRADCVAQLGKPALDGIHQVICGGESGGNARPMNPDWARSLRDQCAAVEVPFFFKQWGEWLPYGQVSPNLPDPHEKDGGEWCSYNDTRKNSVTPYQRWMARRPGKKAAGRLLDGVEHNAIPEVTA